MRKIRLITIAVTSALMVCATSAYAQNPFAIDGVVLDTQNSKTPTGAAAKVTDPDGASKELGPKNGSPQQIGNIHTAPIPMLADTNPNGNNDLNAVWTQTQQSADGHTWLYYGWSRQTAGTGIIGIELEKAVPTCDYANLTACNPWGKRAAGDVIFLWDTQGGATVIVKRIFIDTNGAADGGVVLPACPLGFPTNQTPECSVVDSGAAVFSNSVGTNLRGEAAIDLTDEGIIPLNQCVTFTNIIPFSGTGNSDSADIKDAVLNPFPPITNCGVVTVKKVLLNLTGSTQTFSYTVDRVAGDPKPGVGSIPGTLIHNETDTIADLTPAANYTLVEAAPTAPFSTWKIYCQVTGGSVVTLFDTDPTTTEATQFTVAAGVTTACTIENRALGTPGGSSAQSGRLHDSLVLSNVISHPGLSMTATFSLYTAAGCAAANRLSTGPVGSGNAITTSISFVAAPEGQTTSGTASTLGTVGFGTTGSGTYFWKVEWSGDSINAGNSFCTENTAITFND